VQIPPSDASHNKNKSATKTMNLLQQAATEMKTMIMHLHEKTKTEH